MDNATISIIVVSICALIIAVIALVLILVHDDDGTSFGRNGSIITPVLVATTKHLPDMPNIGVGATVDGVTLVSGDRVLVKDQDNPQENGIYVYTEYFLSRAADFNSTVNLIHGAEIYVKQGKTFFDRPMALIVDRAPEYFVSTRELVEVWDRQMWWTEMKTGDSIDDVMPDIRFEAMSQHVMSTPSDPAHVNPVIDNDRLIEWTDEIQASKINNIPFGTDSIGPLSILRVDKVVAGAIEITDTDPTFQPIQVGGTAGQLLSTDGTNITYVDAPIFANTGDGIAVFESGQLKQSLFRLINNVMFSATQTEFHMQFKVVANELSVGELAYPSADGTVNQVLATDGAGTIGFISVSNEQNEYTAVVPPTVNDDDTQGFSIGSHWIDTAADTTYQLADDSTGAAVWKVTSSSGVTDHTFLTSIGTNTHAQIDTHLADTGNPHSVSHFQLPDKGTNTHAQIDVAITNSISHIANLSNPHATTKVHVGLGNVQNILSNFVAVVPPLVTDDSTIGYAVGSMWVDTAADKTYECVDSSLGAAVWVETSAQGVTDHTLLTNIGTNTHAQIDTHLANVANPHVVTKAQVGLGNVQNILSNFVAVVAPLVTDDSSIGYAVGSMWVDTIADKTYECVDSSLGAAVWVETSSQGVTDHTLLSNIGTNTHAQIDTHLAATNNPHTVTHFQLPDKGTNTHAQIDVAITNSISHIANLSNPHATTKAHVGLGNVQNILSNFVAAVAPLVTDDSSIGYTVGSMWIDTVADKTYECVDSSLGAAVWVETSSQGVTDHTLLSNIGGNTHAQIDTHLANTSNPHLVTHAQLPDNGTNTHAQIDTHLASITNPHVVTKAQVGLGNVQNILSNFAAIVAPTVGDDSSGGYAIGSMWIDTVTDKTYECADSSLGAAVWVETSAGVTDHTLLSNIGTNTHAQIDTHLANTSNPHAVTHLQLPDNGTNTHAQIDTHLVNTSNPHSVTHAQLPDNGTNTHAQIDTHLANTGNPHAVTKAQVGLGNVQNILSNFVAIVPPTVGDDSGSGYSTGSRWVDVLADKTYECVDNSLGAAVWVDTSASGSGILNNYTAVVPPTVTDDTGTGYSVGSEWIDIVGGISYRCMDDTLGAAVWIRITNYAYFSGVDQHILPSVSSTYDLGSFGFTWANVHGDILRTGPFRIDGTTVPTELKFRTVANGYVTIEHSSDVGVRISQVSASRDTILTLQNAYENGANTGSARDAMRFGYEATSEQGYGYITNLSSNYHIRFYDSTNGGIGREIRMFGDVSIVGNLYPDADLTYNLGTSALRWNRIYGGQGIFAATSESIRIFPTTLGGTAFIRFENSTNVDRALVGHVGGELYEFSTVAGNKLQLYGNGGIIMEAAAAQVIIIESGIYTRLHSKGNTPYFRLYDSVGTYMGYMGSTNGVDTIMGNNTNNSFVRLFQSGEISISTGTAVSTVRNINFTCLDIRHNSTFTTQALHRMYTLGGVQRVTFGYSSSRTIFRDAAQTHGISMDASHTYLESTANIYANRPFLPLIDSSYTLGGGGNYWTSVYANKGFFRTNGEIIELKTPTGPNGHSFVSFKSAAGAREFYFGKGGNTSTNYSFVMDKSPLNSQLVFYDTGAITTFANGALATISGDAVTLTASSGALISTATTTQTLTSSGNAMFKSTAGTTDVFGLGDTTVESGVDVNIKALNGVRYDLGSPDLYSFTGANVVGSGGATWTWQPVGSSAASRGSLRIGPGWAVVNIRLLVHKTSATSYVFHVSIQTPAHINTLAVVSDSIIMKSPNTGESQNASERLTVTMNSDTVMRIHENGYFISNGEDTIVSGEVVISYNLV